MEFIGIGDDVGVQSEYTQLRKDLDSLLAQREAFEIEADAIHSELMSPGLNGEAPAGIKDPLVDAEGFPRGDLDIYNVRRKRQRLAELNYDHKQLMKRIEDLTKKLFALNPVNEPVSTNPPVQVDSAAQAASSLPSQVSDLLPMAILDEILPESPASVAGVRDGDALLRFGHITHHHPSFMQAIAKLVGSSVEKPIDVVVRRRSSQMGESASSESVQDITVHLTLTPRPWSGRGLLGCHLSPVK